MTYDNVSSYIEDERRDIDAREAEAWAVANNREQPEYNKIRAQLVIQWCINRRDNLLKLTNNLGQLQQQYEAAARGMRPQIKAV